MQVVKENAKMLVVVVISPRVLKAILLQKLFYIFKVNFFCAYNMWLLYYGI